MQHLSVPCSLRGGRSSAISSSRQPRPQQEREREPQGEAEVPSPATAAACCPAPGHALVHHSANLINALVIGRLSSIRKHTSCETILIFAKVVFLRTDWERGFDTVEASCFSCFRTRLLSFCVLQCFSSLQWFLKHWNFLVCNVEKFSFKSGQNGCYLHQNGIIPPNEGGYVCLPWLP